MAKRCLFFGRCGGEWVGEWRGVQLCTYGLWVGLHIREGEGGSVEGGTSMEQAWQLGLYVWTIGPGRSVLGSFGKARGDLAAGVCFGAHVGMYGSVTYHVSHFDSELEHHLAVTECVTLAGSMPCTSPTHFSCVLFHRHG